MSRSCHSFGNNQRHKSRVFIGPIQWSDMRPAGKHSSQKVARRLWPFHIVVVLQAHERNCTGHLKACDVDLDCSPKLKSSNESYCGEERWE